VPVQGAKSTLSVMDDGTKLGITEVPVHFSAAVGKLAIPGAALKPHWPAVASTFIVWPSAK